MHAATMAGAPMASAATPGIDNYVYGQAAAPQVSPPHMYLSATPPSSAAAPPAADASPPAVSYVAASGERGFVNTPVTRVAALPPAVPAVSEGPYTLDSGDRLRVVVFGQDGLTNAYVVDAGGHIDMPLIGSVPARGATTDQLAIRIADKLRDGFIREPHVAVEIEGYRPFFILGEVTQPGQYPYVANMTVETAVAIAGGFGPRGVRDHVTVTRNEGGRLSRFAAPTTFPIHPGDTINVPERWF